MKIFSLEKWHSPVIRLCSCQGTCISTLPGNFPFKRFLSFYFFHCINIFLQEFPILYNSLICQRGALEQVRANKCKYFCLRLQALLHWAQIFHSSSVSLERPQIQNRLLFFFLFNFLNSWDYNLKSCLGLIQELPFHSDIQLWTWGCSSKTLKLLLELQILFYWCLGLVPEALCKVLWPLLSFLV